MYAKRAWSSSQHDSEVPRTLLSGEAYGRHSRGQRLLPPAPLSAPDPCQKSRPRGSVSGHQGPRFRARKPDANSQIGPFPLKFSVHFFARRQPLLSMEVALTCAETRTALRPKTSLPAPLDHPRPNPSECGRLRRPSLCPKRGLTRIRPLSLC